MLQQKTVALIVLSLFLAASALEWGWMRHRRIHYPWRNLLSTLGIGLGQRLLAVLYSGVTLAIFTHVEQWQFIRLSMARPVHWVALFLLFEFFYYWFHRSSHRINWIWATHQVHHSSERLYLPAAIRLGWTGLFSLVWVFWLPLILLGFPAKAVFAMLSINLIYQFVLHTEAIPKLGLIEFFFNTPSHHRAHHGCNPEYLDCNYGGVVIIYDRIFGTFVEESTEIDIRYGLTIANDSTNPFILALAGWKRLLPAMLNSKSFLAALQEAISPPGPARSMDDAEAGRLRWLMCIILTGPALAASYFTQSYGIGWFMLPEFFHVSVQ